MMAVLHWAFPNDIVTQPDACRAEFFSNVKTPVAPEGWVIVTTLTSSEPERRQSQFQCLEGNPTS